jgi:hypothetical protein
MRGACVDGNFECQANEVNSVKLPKSFVAINLSEKVPEAFSDRAGEGKSADAGHGETLPGDSDPVMPPGNLDG